MQTTLLGLAIAIILALVAALVAPLVVDWNHYRAAFEDEAGRLTGLSVHVGSIDARILPSPIIKLRDVEIGEPRQRPQLRADALELEVGLAPLVRGQIAGHRSASRRAAVQSRVRPFRRGCIARRHRDRSARKSFRSRGCSVEDGSIVFADASSGAHVVLRKLSFNGDIRSLAGPFRGEGAFVAGDEPLCLSHIRRPGRR